MGTRGTWRNAVLIGGAIAFSCAAADWPQFRGPTHNGVSTDRIITNWTGAVTNALWRVPVSNALCSLAVSGGKVFTQARRNIGGVFREVCVALSATHGVELWATPFLLDAAFYDGGVGFDDGPRTTPAVADGSVFVLTSYLKLYRLNATDGVVVWEKNLAALYGSQGIGWQNAASPVVVDGRIYLNGNPSTLTLMAFNAADGSLVWRNQNERLTHASPTAATIHGVPQIIFATQQGLISVNPTNGNLLWRTNYPFAYQISLGASPVVWEDIVFITGARAYLMGSVAYQVTVTNNVWSMAHLWTTNTTSSHWMTPVAHNGHLYGHFGIPPFDSPDAQLTCLDIRTGAVKWLVQGFGRAAAVLVGDHLVSLTERGDVVLVQADPTAYTELGRFQAIPNYHSFSNKCWNFPAVADGKLYVRSSALAAAFDLAIPPLKLESPLFTRPGQLQLTVGTVSGAPMASNRAAAVEILATTNLVEPLASWTTLTNVSLWTNGRVRVDNIDASTESRRYFITREPK